MFEDVVKGGGRVDLDGSADRGGVVYGLFVARVHASQDSCSGSVIGSNVMRREGPGGRFGRVSVHELTCPVNFLEGRKVSQGLVIKVRSEGG